MPIESENRTFNFLDQKIAVMQMKKAFYLFGIIFFTSLSISVAQSSEDLARGFNFMETQTHTQEENDALLKLYGSLRVSDVSDGMDKVGLPNKGLVDPEIHPAWVDVSDMSHVMRGIAVTCRYVPTQRKNQPEPGEDFKEWHTNFYVSYSPEKFKDALFPGSVLVRDGVLGRENSGIGSNNILNWVDRGMVGVLSNATARDVDEIALQKIPLYFRENGRGTRCGRSELESVNRPVNIGGVLVCPGDVVVADGDGVIVVPRYVAVQVAEHAHGVLTGDKAGRAKLYEKLGLPEDPTIK